MSSRTAPPQITPHRRPTSSSRLRENKAQASNAARNRRKSRSPDARPEDGGPGRSGPFVTLAKKRRAGAIPASNNPGGSTSRPPSSVDEFGVEQGRRTKNNRPQAQLSEGVELHVIQDTQTPRRHAKGRRKDRSRSREAGHRGRKEDTPEGDDMETGEDKESQGPMDYARLKEELDVLRKNVNSAKKTIHKQNKIIDELKRDVANTERLHDEERQQTAKLKAETKKLNEMVTAVEANLACQICMDILLKPYGLSPCGHVLCLGCLQEWFRTTPPGEEDMEDEDPEAVLYRKKSCPVCRTDVFHRPIPLFVIKSIATAFEKAKSGSPRQPSPPCEGDPWEGIFPQAYSPYSADGDDDSYDDEDVDDEDSDGPWPGYGSDSEDDFYDGDYVVPHWAPPTVYVTEDDYPFEHLTDELLSMLRRGATLQMISLFSMTYSHDEGLMACYDGNEIYLGWNISLKPDDLTGEEFMDWIQADIVNHEERWDRSFFGRQWTAWRLVKEEEDEEFEDSSSEAWADELADYPYREW